MATTLVDNARAFQRAPQPKIPQAIWAGLMGSARAFSSRKSCVPFTSRETSGSVLRDGIGGTREVSAREKTVQ